MNVERLYALTEDLLDDYHETDIANKLHGLVEHLQNQVNTPSEPTYQKNVADTLQEIRQNLKNAPSNDFDEDRKNIMVDLKIESDFGQNLLQEINNIFSENQITPAIALEKIKGIHSRTAEVQKCFAKIKESFEWLEIDQDSLEEGECEISITIPRSYSDNKLDKLGKEMKLLSENVLRPFVEATGKTPDGFSVRGISSSDPTIYLHAVPVVTISIMTAVKLALSIYKDILDIKKHKQELEKLNLKKKVSEVLDEVLDGRIKELSEKHAKNYIEKIQSNKENLEVAGRSRDELQNQIAKSLTKLVKRFDVGFSFNFRGEMHIAKTEKSEEGNAKPVDLSTAEKENNNHIEEIQSVTKTLIYRNNDEPQIPDLLKKIDEESIENDNHNENIKVNENL